MKQRRRVLTAAATTLALGLIAVGCGSDTPAAGSPAADLSGKNFKLETSSKQVELGALDNQYTPPYIEVRRGTTVTFENDGRNPHNVLPGDDDAFTPIETDAFQPGASATVTFDQVGDFPFYCSLHGTATKGMTGAIRVVE